MSNRIKELRKEYGLTQEDIAKKLGLTRSAISSYERGRLEPTFQNIIKLADMFDVSTKYLMGLSLNRNSEDDDRHQDIRVEVENLMKDISIDDGLTYDSKKITNPTREMIIKSLESTLNLVDSVSKAYDVDLQEVEATRQAKKAQKK